VTQGTQTYPSAPATRSSQPTTTSWGPVTAPRDNDAQGTRFGGSPTWAGFCHHCRRYDAPVRTRYDHVAKTLCDRCATTAPTPTTTTRRHDRCDMCGRATRTEYSLTVDARLCDPCWSTATTTRSSP
jgi:hypothetical protein